MWEQAAFLELFEKGSAPFLPVEIEALVERGELVPRSFVAGRDVGYPIEDLAEP
jgi:hypothetical protein